MDLTFQVPMQYCSLQRRTLLLSPVTSTTGCCFCFGSVTSFFLELFLHWSPVAYCTPTDLGYSSFSVLSFCLFILFMGSQGKNTEVVCHALFPVDHVLSELSTMTPPSWLALHGMTHSFIELDKVWSVWSIWLVLCDFGFHPVGPLMEKAKSLWASWLERLTEGGTVSCSDGWGHVQ